jgi:hypothetical protein
VVKNDRLVGKINLVSKVPHKPFAHIDTMADSHLSQNKKTVLSAKNSSLKNTLGSVKEE